MDPTQPEPPGTCRVCLVIDIATSPTIALTLARSRLAEVIAKLHRHNIGATSIRIDVDGYSYLGPFHHPSARSSQGGQGDRSS